MKYAFNFYCLGSGRKGNVGWQCLGEPRKCSGKETSQPLQAPVPPLHHPSHEKVFPDVQAEPSNLQIVALVLFTASTKKSLLHYLWKLWFELLLDFPLVSSSRSEIGAAFPRSHCCSCSPGIWWPWSPLLDFIPFHHAPLALGAQPGWHIPEWPYQSEQRGMITSLQLLPCSFPRRSLCGLPMGSSYKVGRKVNKQSEISSWTLLIFCDIMALGEPVADKHQLC